MPVLFGCFGEDVIGEEADPQDNNGQSTQQGEEAHGTGGCVGFIFKGIEDDQSEPDDGQIHCAHQLFGLVVCVDKDVIANHKCRRPMVRTRDLSVVSGYRQYMQLQIYHYGVLNKYEDTHPEDGQDSTL